MDTNKRIPRPWRRIEKFLAFNAGLLVLLLIGVYINNRQAYRAERGNNLLQLQILQRLNQNSAGKPAEKKTAVIDTDGLAYLGSPTAPLTIILVSDFECPFCKKVGAEHLAAVRKDFVDTGLLGIYYLNAPLKTHLLGQEAALAGWAAHQQGKFWEFFDALGTSGNLSPEGYLACAKSLGLDIQRFETDFRSAAAAEEIQRQIAVAAAVPVPGVPALVLREKLLLGENAFVELKDNLTAWYMSKAQEITQLEFSKLPVQDRPVILDVRTAEEVAAGMIPGARHISLGSESFIEDVRRQAPALNQSIILYCAGGMRSAYAWHLLRSVGYTQVVSLIGGYETWKKIQ